MYVVCLDLEGVLVPEVWINVAEATGIEELRLTTRDISDYDVLMKKRLGILDEREIGLSDIQRVIEKMEPLEGARAFIDELRELTQVVILSDTFTEFAAPMMRKLAWPTLLCNSLVVRDDRIVDYTLRIRDGKRRAVEALENLGYSVIAGGDSYNDISMLERADHGLLFRPPANVVAEYPQFPVVEIHSDMLAHIKTIISANSDRE